MMLLTRNFSPKAYQTYLYVYLPQGTSYKNPWKSTIISAQLKGKLMLIKTGAGFKYLEKEKFNDCISGNLLMFVIISSVQLRN